MIKNFFIKLTIILDNLFVIIGLRRRSTYWGVVYDSISKQPLDPVIIKMVDAKDNKVVQSGVTDLAGRYNFLAFPGKFKILVKRSNYTFPSKIVVGEDDGIYSNLYHGELFELTGGSSVIPFNIPMDKEEVDWNQQAKLGITKFNPYTENFVNKIVSVVFWFLLIFSALEAYLYKINFALGVVFIYVILFLLIFLVPRPRPWGRVWFKQTGLPALGAFIELSYAQTPGIIVAKGHIYQDGKFFMRINPGKYILEVKTFNSDGQTKVAFKKKIRVGSEQVVNYNFAI